MAALPCYIEAVLDSLIANASLDLLAIRPDLTVVHMHSSHVLQ